MEVAAAEPEWEPWRSDSSPRLLHHCHLPPVSTPIESLEKPMCFVKEVAFIITSLETEALWGISACCANSTKYYPSMLLCPPNSQPQVYRT